MGVDAAVTVSTVAVARGVDVFPGVGVREAVPLGVEVLVGVGVLFPGVGVYVGVTREPRRFCTSART